MKQFGKYILIGVDPNTFGVGAYVGIGGDDPHFCVFVGPFYVALSFKKVV